MEKAAIRQQILHDLNRRYATKKYDPNKHLVPADWETILTAGRLSPSSYGYEPWKFVLLDQQARQDIQPFAWGAVASAKGADKLIAILVRKDVTYNSPYVQHLVRDIKHKEFSETDPRTLNFKNFQENDLQLKTDQDRYNWASRQAYLALANMLMAAARLDVDSCPIEGFNYAQMNQYLADRGVMDPAHWGVAVMASFGYRDQEITPKVRQPLTDIYKEM